MSGGVAPSETAEALLLRDATAQARALVAGEISSEQLIEATLSAIARYNPRLNCFLHVDAEGARRAARDSDLRRREGLARGPLDGLPVAVKDNIDVCGMPTTAGLRQPLHLAATDAPVVQRLRDAGGVLVGKLNMDEAALGTANANPHHGACYNPWGSGHVPGGSSGGSGSAVAAGLCALALGTDTMGSVRIPAACCGVVGLKPSTGRIPNRGVVACSRRLDTVGPLVRGVRDLDWILPLLEGLAPADASGRLYPDYEPVSLPLDGLSLAVAPDLGASVGLSPAVEKLYRETCDLLQAQGASLHAVSVAALDFGACRRAGLMVVEGDLRIALAEPLAKRPEDISPGLHKMLAWIAGRSAPALAAADWALDRAAEDLLDCLGGRRALLLPTVPVPAFPHGEGVPSGHADLTAMVNMAGLPAISIPAGLSPEGLPLALQLIGALGAEAELVAMATALAEYFPACSAPLASVPGEGEQTCH